MGTATVAPEQTGGVPVGPAPESTWVVIQVSGQFDAKPNPECAAQPPNWPCIFNAPTSNYYEPAPFTSGPVQAWVASTRTSQVPLRGTGGAVNTAGQAVGLYFGTAPGELVVLSALQNFGTQNPNPVGKISSWIFSGAYHVTATRIPNPLTFSGGPTGDAAGTATFTVGTTAPLQFINPVGVPSDRPPGAVDWWFVPGDSVPLNYERTSQSFQVFSCWLRTTCTFTPPATLNGRMQVLAYVEGRLVIGRSDYVHAKPTTPPPAPQASVVCTPSPLVRGSQVTCQTSVSPAMPFTVTSRTARGTNIVVADGDPHAHAAGEIDEWTGTAVADTRIAVTVQMNVNGADQTLSASGHFKIIPRVWNEYQITSPRVLHAIYPNQMDVLPGTPPHSNYGVMNLTRFLLDSAGVDSVGGGPNKDVLYFETQPQFEGPIGQINLHPALYPPFPPTVFGLVWSVWYADQNGAAGPNWSGLYRPCDQPDMPNLRQELERHEGVTLAPNSHVALANRVFHDTKLHQQFEGHYEQNVSRSDFRWRSYGLINDWWRQDYWPVQHDFDVGLNNDPYKTWAAVGCLPDNDLKAP